MKAFDLLRAIVSQEKERYIEDGFDLDLTYITSRVIAMGFPSSGLESYYRNPMTEVERFLQAKHPNHYRVYNLCCERSYPTTSFLGHVVTYGFVDHTPPPLEMLAACSQDMGRFLAADDRNVCVVHCKAGKGRTGVAVCAHLLLSGVCATVDEALDLYANRRTRDRQGITIPSQRRFVEYFARCIARPGQVTFPEPRVLRLQRIVVSPPPAHSCTDLQLRIMGPEYDVHGVTGQTVLFEREGPSTVDADAVTFEAHDPVVLLRGPFDVRVRKRGKKKPLLHFWLDTRFIDGAVTLTKAEIDGPHLDRDHVLYAATMAITCHFVTGSVGGADGECAAGDDFGPGSPLSNDGPVHPGSDSDYDRYDRDP